MIVQVDVDVGRVFENFFGDSIADVATDGSLAWVTFGDRDILPVATLAIPSPFFHQGNAEVTLPGPVNKVAGGPETVWALDSTNGSVYPIDPHRGNVGRAIDVGPDAWDLMLGGGYVWVANHTSIARVDPSVGGVDIFPFPGRVSSIAFGGPAGAVWVLVDEKAPPGGSSARQ